MKVLLISDFGIRHNIGGAQRSNQIILDEGINRGHDISIYHYDTDQSVLWDMYDIVISSNLEVISRTNPMVIQYCATSNNHVRLEHDFCRYLDNNVRQYLYTSCKKTFFLTNYHHRKFIEYYGDYFVNVEIVPDPIDIKKFYNKEKHDRSDIILYIGFMHYLKGTDNFIQYAENNQDKKFEAFSWGDEQYINKLNNLSNVYYRGKVPFEAMPEIFNNHKEMYYNPVFDEPFCRTVGEALMCGLDIIGESNKIGSLHMYQEDPVRFASKCNNAARNFWEILENV